MRNRKRRQIVIILMTLIMGQLLLVGAGKKVGAELRDEGIKFFDLDKVIIDGGDLSDIPNDNEQDTSEEEEELIVEVPTPEAISTHSIVENEKVEPLNTAETTPTIVPTINNDISIMIRNKNIYVNNIICRNTDSYMQKVSELYQRDSVVKVYDVYAEYHILSDVINYLEMNGIPYTTIEKDEY